MCPCINRNARPNNNQRITYYQCVSYLPRILQYFVNNTYNKDFDQPFGWAAAAAPKRCSKYTTDL